MMLAAYSRLLAAEDAQAGARRTLIFAYHEEDFIYWPARLSGCFHAADSSSQPLQQNAITPEKCPRLRAPISGHNVKHLLAGSAG